MNLISTLQKNGENRKLIQMLINKRVRENIETEVNSHGRTKLPRSLVAAIFSEAHFIRAKTPFDGRASLGIIQISLRRYLFI